MEKYMITRRMLLKAGLAAAVAAVIPVTGFSAEIPEYDAEPIVSDPNEPHENSNTGSLPNGDAESIKNFSRWAIDAWGFEDMDNYPSQLSGMLSLKTNAKPSYLSEYKNASELIRRARIRLGDDNQAFIYLLFAGRDETNIVNTRLGRAQKFVFDEVVRHMVANGGFKKFGFVNYKGFISSSFTDQNSYRRSAV